MVEVMSIDRADVEEAQFLEQRAAGNETARVLLGAARRHAEAARKLLRDFGQHVPQRAIWLGGDELREIGAHGADRRGDRHVIVVEDNDQSRTHRPGVVHRLIGHAGAHRAIADDGDDVVLLAAKIAGDRHAESGRDRRRGMRRAKRIVDTLRSLGKAGQTAALPQRQHPVAPAGEDLVGIGLVAYVPDQLVARGREHVVQGHGQLDDA